jgi:large subunit ribosomal protein L4
MTTIKVQNSLGEEVGEAKLPDAVFGIDQDTVYSRKPLIHQVVVAQLAAARQGTHKVKTRAEVSGGGRKPFKQKGTGRARQGSIRAPHYSGGGIAHGPTPSDYSQRTPKKMRQSALHSVISDRANANRIYIVDSFGLDTPSTKAALETIEALAPRLTVLVVVSRAEETAILSIRNIPTVEWVYEDQLSSYDVLVNDCIVWTKDALETFLQGYDFSFDITVKASSAKGSKVTGSGASAEDAEASEAKGKASEEVEVETDTVEAEAETDGEADKVDTVEAEAEAEDASETPTDEDLADASETDTEAVGEKEDK